MLIETTGFLAVQLRDDTLTDAIRIASTTHQTCTASFNGDGSVLSILAMDRFKETQRALAGEFVYSDFNEVGVAKTLDELVTIYELKVGKVEGDTPEQKIANIEFAKFTEKLEQYEHAWKWSDFPHDQTAEDLMQRARHGMTDGDVRNFSAFLARTIATATRRLADDFHNGVGDVPNELRVRIDAWNHDMRFIADVFEDYLKGEGFDEDKVQEAFDLLRDRLFTPEY